MQRIEDDKRCIQNLESYKTRIERDYDALKEKCSKLEEQLNQINLTK